MSQNGIYILKTIYISSKETFFFFFPVNVPLRTFQLLFLTMLLPRPRCTSATLIAQPVSYNRHCTVECTKDLDSALQELRIKTKNVTGKSISSPSGTCKPHKLTRRQYMWQRVSSPGIWIKMLMKLKYIWTIPNFGPIVFFFLFCFLNLLPENLNKFDCLEILGNCSILRLSLFFPRQWGS